MRLRGTSSSFAWNLGALAFVVDWKYLGIPDSWVLYVHIQSDGSNKPSDYNLMSINY